jgi:hypothetical protein
MSQVRVIAIDWSGRAFGAEKTIWLAEAAAGRIVRLENGRDRDEIASWLIADAARDTRMVIGFDFAFSLPAWYVREGFGTAPALWAAMHAGRADELLAKCAPPFWGKPGKPRPRLPEHFRVTDRAHSIGGIRPKSVFQVGGAGAVGTGSLRGMPVLHRLREAGFSVWPFCEGGPPRVIEIYPRLMTGPVNKSDPAARAAYLDAHYTSLDPALRRRAASTEDAFDAAVSALVMSQHTHELAALPPAADEQERIEGRIWAPEGATCGY